jgi:hypothetical protein
MSAGAPCVNSVGVFIPSKDRALQLDAALRSLARHCEAGEPLPVSVVFRATSEVHQEAYRTARAEHPGVRFIEERAFSRQVRALLVGKKPRRDAATVPDIHLLIVDDTVFIADFSLKAVLSALNANSKALGFSLRLGETIRFCQPLRIESPPPHLEHVAGGGSDEILRFSWKDLPPDWGYPLDISSSLYRREHLRYLLEIVKFDSPTMLEDGLWNAKEAVRSMGELLCFRRPRAVSLAINRVQSIALNPTSDHHRHAPDVLARHYLKGWRVDVGAYDGYVPSACHEEFELILRRVTNR